MDRRQFNAALAGAALLLPGCARSVVATPPTRTRWLVTESEGYDALCFWAPLAGEPASAAHYSAEVAAFVPNFDARALQTITAIHRQVAAAGNVMVHSACRLFSAGPHRTIDDLIDSARNIDTVLKPRHLADPDWEGEELWERFKQMMPPAIMILEAMKAAGFPAFRQRLYQSRHSGRTAELLAVLAPYDAVGEARFLTGRSFEPEVEVALTYFGYPRGMRMLGQQFVTWAGYSDDIILNMSAHELMHPPLDLQGAAMTAALAELRRDPFWTGIVTRRDPQLGDLGDLPNYVEECMVQALDQIAGDRRGSSRRAADFFSRSGGSDVLAACIYGLLREDGYQRTGGNFEAWLARAVAAGRFSTASLEAAGTRILGASPRTVWRPYTPPST